MSVKSETFNRDCVEAMKEYPDNYFELAIVDPPYGQKSDNTKIFTSNSKNKATERPAYKEFDNVKPTDDYFAELKRVSQNQIIWGGNFFGLSGGYICWNKNGTAFGECELAYCSMFMSVRLYEFTWNGMIQGNMKKKESRIHPTQKPVELYKWLLLNYAKTGDKILDTHLGSQSSRIACYELGFEFTGYEKDEHYFNEGNKRFDEHIKQGKLF